MAAWPPPAFSRSLFFSPTLGAKKSGRTASETHPTLNLDMHLKLNSVLLLLIFAISNSLWAAPLTVMLDPGHGGRDHGTTKDSIHEADINLAVAQHLSKLLKNDRRFRVMMTRNSDASVSLNDRSRLAKERKADVFLSIHVNSSPDLNAHGAEFYFQNQLPPDEQSMFLAHQEEVSESGAAALPMTYDFLDRAKYPTEINAILVDLLDGSRIQRSSDLSKALKTKWGSTRFAKSHSIRQAPFHVLIQMPVPSALVELGFLTNQKDYSDLINPLIQKKMSTDLFKGLIAYKESLDKGP